VATLGCPSCGEELVPRHYNQDGSPFYGCSSFFDTDCRGSLKFIDAVRNLNELNELEEWVEFEDIDF
jgi:hypothetical protein